MHKRMNVVLVVLGLLLRSAYGMQTMSDADDKKTTSLATDWSGECLTIASLSPRLQQIGTNLAFLVALDAERAVGEFVNSAFTPSAINDRQKNKLDQGRDCVKALRILRRLTQIVKEENATCHDWMLACFVVDLRNNLSILLPHLDEVGRMRMLWYFMLKYRIVSEDNDLESEYIKNPSRWLLLVKEPLVGLCKKNDKVASWFEKDFCGGCDWGDWIIGSPQERASLQADYKAALDGYVAWLKGLVASKDEKTTAKTS